MKYKCTKCKGTGKVIFTHVENGICFDCNGKGFINYNPNKERIEWLENELIKLQTQYNYYENKYTKLLQEGVKAVNNNDESKRKLTIQEIKNTSYELDYYKKKVNEFQQTIEKECAQYE